MLMLLVATACKEVFEKPPQSLLEAYLFDSSTKNALTSIVTVQGLGLDSLWADKTSMTKITLPLSPNDTTSYLITFDSTTDTITFLHETYQKYLSMETGFYFEYKLRSIEYSHNRIDSVQIIDSLVTTKWHENIKLYIHPLPAGS
jgi:hypothetical protein